MKSTHVRDLPARDRLIRARTLLTQSHAFYASLALHMEPREDAGVPTAEVDGKHMFYNPNYVTGLTEPELIGLVVHETKHIALLHHVRRGGRDPAEWNVSCDLAINPGLIAEGFTLPKGALLDPTFAGMSAEQIYAERQRRKQQPQPPQDQDQDPDADQDGDPAQDQPGANDPGQDQDDDGQDGDGGQSQAGGDPGGCGGVRDAYLEEGQGVDAAAAETEAMVRQCAAVAARGAGEGGLPDAISRLLDELNQPRVNWREEFGRFVDSVASSQPTWNRLDRRMLALGYSLPGRTPDAVEEMVCFVDSSASIPRDGATAFASEVQAMLDTGRVSRIHVVSVDDAVRNVQVFELGDTVAKLDIKGGGGTRFDVAFDWLADNAPDAAAAIYLTDLDVWSDEWGRPPACPVLWTVYGGKRWAPFGEIIPLDPYQ